MLTEQERHDIQMELAQRLGLGGLKEKFQSQLDTTSGIAKALESGLIREWERREPVTRPRSISADFTLPLLRSLMSGVFAAPVVSYLTGDIAWGMWTFGLASGLTWLVQMINDTRLNWRIERLVGRDLDGDGWVGEPEKDRPTSTQQPPTRNIQVEHKSKLASNTWRYRWSKIPEWLNEDKLSALAHLIIVEGQNFSRRGVSAVITQDEYPELVEAFKAENFLFEQGNGWALRGSGRRFLQKFLDNAD